MTDTRVQVLLDALKGGNTRVAACDYAQISRETFYRWLEQDSTFRDSVVHAEAQAEIRMAAIVVRAAQGGDAPSARWWLERRRRADYGAQLDVTLEFRREIERLTSDPLEREAALREVEAILSAKNP